MDTAIVNLTDFVAWSVGLGEGWGAPAGAGVAAPQDPLSRGWVRAGWRRPEPSEPGPEIRSATH